MCSNKSLTHIEDLGRLNIILNICTIISTSQKNLGKGPVSSNKLGFISPLVRLRCFIKID